MPDVSVVIPARDAESLLGLTLDALARQELDDDVEVEVIVVDDASRDGTAALAAARGARVVRQEHSQGAGPARNAGAAASTAPVLAFTDADCEPVPGWLRATVAALATADIAIGPVEPVSAPGPLDRTLRIAAETGLFETANLVVRREVFERVGGFPRGFETPGETPFGEDVMFGWKAVRSGARVAFCPHALVHHAVRPRGAREFLAERRRLGLFPRLTREVPELRRHFLYARWFLNRRTARFDLAAAGLACALLLRRRMPLLALAPYARLVWHDRRTSGRRAAAVRVLADGASAAALARGSATSRSLVI
jgi:glycosyltransferase involved in cell wall biosynthesis